MAVNASGAGGVKPGTLYAAIRAEAGETRVVMYEPKAGGTLKFVMAWQVRSVAGAYERCGPRAVEEGVGSTCKAEVNKLPNGVDVEVDQITGNVYVLNEERVNAGSPAIVEYKPDGSAEITRFGIKAAPGETTAASPEKIHESRFPSGIAVDGAGKVYVFDLNNSNNFYHRLMVFEPQTPGDYEHYVYAGLNHDIGAGFFGEGSFPMAPVTDATGHVYVAGLGENYIEEYDPTQPSDPPICRFEFTKGGINSMTVDPDSGEVFFYSEKKEAGFKTKLIHQLSPCSGGEFKETGKFEVAPERNELFALAFDPVRQFSAGRAPGVLYGGAPGPEPAIGKGEPGQSSLGYVFAPVEENPPVIGSESVTNVTSTTAQLHAEINPKGFQVRYALQYITDLAYQENPPGERFNGAGEAPLGGGVLAGGNVATSVGVTLMGLLPQTEYHYRAIATSNCAPGEPTKVCPATGADQGFITLPAQGVGLPDGRAYEMVSPADKHNGQVLPADSSLGLGTCGTPECKPGNGNTRFPVQSSPDGEVIVYEGTPFSPSGGAAIENEYIAPRNGVAGWQTTNLTPSLLGSKGGGGYKAFAPALGEGLLQQIFPTLNLGAPAGYPNFYLQSTANPLTLRELLTESPPNRLQGNGSERLELTYAGASADLSRIFFEANDALTKTTPVAPEASGGVAGETNLYEWAGGQLRLVNVAPGNAETFPDSGFGAAPSGPVSHSISLDGSRVYWSSKTGQVYVRINGEETREIEDPGRFLTASVDGSSALLDDGCLYDLEAEECDDLTADESGVPQGGFQGLVGQSEDLSHVYFVDTAVLTEKANEQGEEAQAGKNNLYAWNEGSTVFVATLLPKDNAVASGGGDWGDFPSARTAEASPQGRWLAFLSHAPLSGYDNTGPCPVGFNPIGPCPEAFLYDSDTGELRCASCNPSDSSPLGYTVLRLIEGATSALPQARYLTDSGRLYFDSRDSLSSFDTNEGVEDVYQFEPDGVGSCKRDAGCVSLISAGREAIDSNFLAMDPTGENVFFTTRDRLVPSDEDELIDLYDARVGGGFASESELPPGECKGEACQPPPSTQPVPPPPSSSFVGPGNAKPTKCKKNQVKRNGRCVKKSQHKKQHGKSRKQSLGSSK
jgi:hypothetical protein